MSRYQPARPALRAMTLRLAMGLTFPLALTLALPAQAETGQQQYNIAAGPLNTVLTRFATASGTLIAGDIQLAAGKQSQGRHRPGGKGTAGWIVFTGQSQQQRFHVGAG